MRVVLVAAAFCAAFGSVAEAAPERGAPWCAEVQVGWGEMQRDCSYPTLEACVPHVLSGNRGMCIENPAWTQKPQPATRPAKRRVHRY